MDPFQRGDRVRLTARCAATFNRSYRRKCDWTKREGAVAWVSPDRSVHVRWDGVRTYDHWPAKALELVVPEIPA